METTLLITLGVLVLVALAVGIYRLATRNQHESSILRVHSKVQRRENFSTIIFAILSFIGLIAVLFVLTLLLRYLSPSLSPPLCLLVRSASTHSML